MEGANQVLETCASTNDITRRLGELGHPHGTWISARRQTEGRGRRGRSWIGEDGGLLLSVLLRIPRETAISWIPLAVAVGCVEAAEQARPGIDVRLKWPNDLWLDGGKVGGILCEGVGGPSGSFVVAGIGINCAGSPDGLDQPTTSLGCSVDLLRPRVVDLALKWVARLSDEGPGPISRFYEDRAALGRGAPISWGPPSARVEGRVLGLGPFGDLRVESNSREISLFAEDVKLRSAAREASG